MSRKLSLLSIVVALVLTGAGCISFSGNSGAVGPTGVFRSSDKGETWQQTNTLPTAKGLGSLAGVKVYRLFADPTDPNALYMGSRGQGLFFSYDRGDTWQKVNQLGEKFIYGLSVDPSNKCVIYVTDGVQIFKTTDCSRTWKSVYSDLNARGIRSLAIDPSAPQAVYGSLLTGEIIKSSDAGESWKVIKTFNQNISTIFADPLTPGRLFVAGVSSGLVRSDDGGVTWKSLTPGLQNYSDSTTFYRLAIHPKVKDLIYWVSKYGILVSKDAGETWTDLKLLSAPGSVSIYAFGVSPDNTNELYYVGTVYGENNTYRSTFYKSVDGGTNWVTKKLPSNTIPSTMIINPVQSNLITLGFTIPDNQ